MEKQTCENCIYWKGDTYLEGNSKYGRGACVRFPPKENYDTNSAVEGVIWIQTNYDNFCGEFKIKE